MVLWFSNRSDVNNYTQLPPLSILMTIVYYILFYLVTLSAILGRNNSGRLEFYFWECICKPSLVYTLLCEISGDTRVGHAW